MSKSESDTELVDGDYTYYTTSLTRGPRWAACCVYWWGHRICVDASVARLNIPSTLAQHIGAIFYDVWETSDTWSLEDMIFSACLPEIRYLPRRSPLENRQSLHDYYHAPTRYFELENVDGQLIAVLKDTDYPAKNCGDFPFVPLADEVVACALRDGLPCFTANELLIVRDETQVAPELYKLPEIVMRAGDDEHLYWFRPAKAPQFDRELSTLLQVRKRLPQLPLVSRLVGLIRWDDEPGVAGLLIEYIPNTKTLSDKFYGSAGTAEERAAWLRQMRQTVEQLHAADIVWGDAKPSNVLIDAQGQTWIIDFGGGWDPEFVSPDLQGTKDGDLQGLRAMAAKAGVNW